MRSCVFVWVGVIPHSIPSVKTTAEEFALVLGKKAVEFNISCSL